MAKEMLGMLRQKSEEPGPQLTCPDQNEDSIWEIDGGCWL